MKRGIMMLVCVLAAGMAVAQSPDIIWNTKTMMDGVSNNATKASNEALGISAPAPPSASPSTAKPSAATASAAPKASAAKASAAKSSVPKPSTAAAKSAAAAKTAAPTATVKHAAAKTAPQAAKAASPAPQVVPAVLAVAKAAKPAAGAVPAEAPQNAENKWPLTGKRDPFVSPVVYQTGASNCSGGKKCLEIGQINFRGVVRSESGFIAVVTNGLNKAYFLRENDPVFDGYVVKITDDSIVFQETMQDRLGKTFTKEVVKKLTTPSV